MVLDIAIQRLAQRSKNASVGRPLTKPEIVYVGRDESGAHL